MVLNRLQRALSSPTVEAFIKLVVVASVAASGFAVVQNRETAKRNEDLTRCVAAYNDTNNRRSVALTQATNEERAAERRADDAQAALFLSPAVSKPVGQRTAAETAEILRLFRAYQAALSKQIEERASADDARRAHPIPDPPSEVCG